MNLVDFYRQQGAILADDGIPLHYGDVASEYIAGLNHAILLDRSHEGRIEVTGDNRFDFLNRMSTNDLLNMPLGEGLPTIFINAHGRILDRVVAYHQAESLLLITEPGRGQALQNFLQRQIFYNDKVRLKNIQAHTAQLALHGSLADAIIEAVDPDLLNTSPLSSHDLTIEGIAISLLRRKPISGSHWVFVVPRDKAVQLYETLLKIGKPHQLTLAGSLTYNTLRIRAGRPAGRELSTDFIPLEVGLWDEVSFAKGCYTGQEIIARMESRGQLAKMMVHLNLDEFMPAPATIYADSKKIGQLTSSVQAPDGTLFALGVVKTASARAGTSIIVGEQGIDGSVQRLAGTQPEHLLQN